MKLMVWVDPATGVWGMMADGEEDIVDEGGRDVGTAERSCRRMRETLS
jgi:hypothetical protein